MPLRFSDYSRAFGPLLGQVAGRSCACVDRLSSGRYGVMVANYGGPMRLFETAAGAPTTVVDLSEEPPQLLRAGLGDAAKLGL